MRLSHVLSDLKRLLSPRRAPEVVATPVEVAHPNLGALNGTSEAILGKARFGNSEIEISINPDGQPPEAAIALANTVWLNIDSLHQKCSTLIADRASESYPELNQTELHALFNLKTIEITGDEIATLWYDGRDFFGGHDFSVTSFDGSSFTDVLVEMQG